MLTVGYINTESFLERLVSIFLMLFLSWGFAYSINSIGVIVSNMFKNQVELK